MISFSINNCNRGKGGSQVVTFLFFVLVFLAPTQKVFAQREISPTTDDPGYYSRKELALKRPAKASDANRQLTDGVTLQERTLDTANCFIPIDSTYIAVPRNDDGSFGPVSLPFAYDLYGTSYTQVYINTNGNLTFTNSYSQYNAAGFPINLPMVAGFWADIDTRNSQSGQIYYKVSAKRLTVTWNGVGYFSNNADKLNTFQIILTDGADSTIGVGVNTAFYYKDMQWTTGSASGGSSGFGGTPATVGVNKGNGVNYVQVGRFNRNGDVYEGPAGSANGVNYLDFQCFKFNVTNSSNNIPPSVSGLPVANPVTVNVGDTVRLTPRFIGPEVGQTVTTAVNTHNICRVTHLDSNGVVSKVNLTFIADTCNVGTNVITFTAVDDGTPVQSTLINYTINVNKLNQFISFPALTDKSYGNAPFSLPASASSMLPITYTLTGPASLSGNVLTITGVGTVTVTATQSGSSVFNPAPSVTQSFCVKPGLPSAISGDTIVCLNTGTTYSVAAVNGGVFSWTLSGGGTLSPNGNTATVQWTAAGTYTLAVKYSGSCGGSDSTRMISVLVDDQLTGTFSNLLPANGSNNVMLPIRFSWSAISNALGYDLYIWPVGTSRPSTPVAAEFTQPHFTISDSAILHYEIPYQWQVVAKRNCHSLQSVVQTFTLRYSPDLVVDSIGTPVTGFAGRALKVNWTVKNDGNRLTTVNAWTDRIYVSASPVFVPGSTLVQADFQHNGILFPGSAYSQTQEVVLPQNVSGQFYVYVFTDATQQLIEYNPGGENNNVNNHGFTAQLKMPADLVVSQVTAPASASAGQKAKVQWISKNQGDTALGTSLWYDKIYLSPLSTFDVNNAILVGSYVHSGGLEGSKEYNNSVLATIPSVKQGNYFVYVIADAENNAGEYEETNNSRRSNGTVQIGIPDLMVSNVAIPATVSQGQSLTVRWTVRNAGTGATENAAWTDRIYLSPDGVYTPNNAIWFDARFAPISLESGASIERQINLTVPDLVSGRYYAYVYTDYTKTVYEDTAEYNNIARSTAYSDITTGVPVRDIGVSEILTPVSDCGLGASETVKVKITNYGNLFLSGFNVSYRSNNGTTITENVGTATLLPGSTLTYTFRTKADFSQIAAYSLVAYTSLPNDTLTSNDTAVTILHHFPALGAPGNLLPTDGSTDLNRPVNFSWGAVPNASFYDLYLWKASEPIPATPLAANLTQINYVVSASLLYGTTYKWRVVARSNHCQTASVIHQFTTRLLPDLLVDNIQVPSTGGISENPLSISWRIKNSGLGSTLSEKWYETVYISESPTNRANDVYIGSFQNVSALNAAEAYTHPLYSFTVPQGYQGRYYIVIKTNTYHSLEELTDTNNLRVVPVNITLAPPPDLQVENLVVAPTTLFSEDSINVSWTVHNIGTGPTTASNWTDLVYLSTNATLDPRNAVLLGSFSRNGALLNGAAYSNATSFKLPAHIGGTYYIHVMTDAANKVYEYVHETNNIATWASLNVIMRPNPNLLVSAVTAATDTVSSNQTIALQWIARNEGPAPANPVWLDELRLTGDTANGFVNYSSLGRYSQSNVLPSLSATGAQLTVHLPMNLAEGSYFFYAVSDIYNQVFEGADEADNVSGYSPPVYVVNPDLKPVSLQAPPTASSEGQITVAWTVQNAGKGGVYNAAWTDAIYLSKDTVISSDDIALATVSSNQLVLSGNQYAKQQTLTLPVGIAGTYYLLLRTDAGDNIFEKSESNNQGRIPITITLAPWADLKFAAIQLSARDTAGTPLRFSYQVLNAGAGRVNNKTWSDAFYLSPTTNLDDPNKVLVATVSNTQRSLDTGQSYTNTITIQLPYTLTGTYYLLGTADNSNDIFEHTGENNNRKASDAAVLIASSPVVDLAATAGRVTADSLTPGQTVVVEWTGLNNGFGPTRTVDWEDAIYLSNNPTLDATDRLLKTFTVNRAIPPGGTYTLRNTVTLPNDASGKLYFLVNLDRTNQQGDTLRRNNTRVMELVLNNGGHLVDSGGGIVIVQPLPSDLTPVRFQAPATGVAGQPITISFQVKNNRSGKTNKATWTDRVYLSTDFDLDAGDIVLGSFTHNGRLDSMEQYADTQQVFLPLSASGNFVLLFETDGNDNVFELNAENNNVAFGNILIQPQRPCDLIVNRVVLPAGPQKAGQLVTIGYTLQNIGINPVQGVFSDAVYLSKDSVWDINDLLLGTTGLFPYDLPPLDTVRKQFTAKLTNVAAGEYYVLVRTDILNNISEAQEANNSLSSVFPMTIDVKRLIMGVPANDTLVNNELLYYRIDIPAEQQGATVSFSLQGDSARRAVNRLYLKYAAAPVANASDFVSEIPFAANQEIVVPEVKEGTYYLMASGNDTATNLQSITLLARIIPFEITRVDTKKGGNTGAVTIRINGAKFDSTTRFKLRGAGGYIAASKIYYSNSTQVFATFDLLNAGLGLYDVVATKTNEDSTQLVHGFEIEKGVGSTAGSGSGSPGSGTGFVCQLVNIGFEDQLETGYDYPPSTRPQRLVGISIFYANRGNVDIPVPTRIIYALKNNVPLSLTPEGIASSLAGLGGALGNILGSIAVDFIEPGSPPGILRPGASGFKKIYTIAYESNIGTLDFVISK